MPRQFGSLRLFVMALADALARGAVAGACLDVLADEKILAALNRRARHLGNQRGTHWPPPRGQS